VKVNYNVAMMCSNVILYNVILGETSMQTVLKECILIIEAMGFIVIFLFAVLLS